MPILDFKGKQFVYAHHLSVLFRTLEIDSKKSLPAPGSKPDLDDNLIIHGDNLHALKAIPIPRRPKRFPRWWMDTMWCWTAPIPSIANTRFTTPATARAYRLFRRRSTNSTDGCRRSIRDDATGVFAVFGRSPPRGLRGELRGSRSARRYPGYAGDPSGR